MIRYVCMPGCGFTGSTLLGFLLNAHPRCASIGAATGLIGSVDLEVYRCSCGTLFRECDFWTRVGARTRELGEPVGVFRTGFWTTHFGLYSRPLDALLFRSLRNDSLNALRDALLGSFPPLRRRLAQVGRINECFARAVLELTGKSVFVDSSRDHQRPRLLLAHANLDVRVIHLVKDARANAASILKHRGATQADEAARSWLRANVEAERGRKHFPAAHWLQLHYDELCQDPQATLDRISDFLEIEGAPLPDDFRSLTHHIIGNEMRVGNVGQVRLDESWKQRLSKDDLTAIARVAGDANHRFGFDWP